MTHVVMTVVITTAVVTVLIITVMNFVMTDDCCDGHCLMTVVTTALIAAAVQLTTYKLQPRIAFHIWRPVINENLMRHWFPKPGAKVGSS